MKRIALNLLTITVGLGLALALLCLLSNSAMELPKARAASLTVCPTGPPTCNYSSIQAAVDAASDGDLIKVAIGVYTDVNARLDISLGGIVTQVVYVSKTITIRGGYTTAFAEPPDPEANPTMLDARRQGRVLYITGNISPTIEGLRLTGGNALGLGGSSVGGGGGGVYVITATAALRNSRVFSNTANEGGGLYLLQGTATLSENTITSNTTDFDGGGLYLDRSAATLNNNIFASNVGRFGGGLYAYGSSVTLNHNTFAHNTALGYWWPPSQRDNVAALDTPFDPASLILLGGGGLILRVSTATLDGNIIVANTSGSSGGGLLLDYSNATLTNNVVADNLALSWGGGLESWASSLRLLNTTLARNGGPDGLGVWVMSRSFVWGTVLVEYPSVVTMTNTILAGHKVGIQVSPGNTATLEATLWGAGAWANLTDWSTTDEYGYTGTLVAGTINVRGDPAFVNPDRGDYHIGPTSAAIDRGVYDGVTTDMDGERRPVGEGYDIGADEFPAALRVTKSATPDPVQAGAPLTYTIHIVNTGNVTLHAAVTDTLPVHILPGVTPGGSAMLPGGTLTWQPVLTVPAGDWTQQFVVTVETGYTGTLANAVQVTTLEGATGVYTVTVNKPPTVYLPLIFSTLAHQDSVCGSPGC